jgi:uncharacterized membrane protein YqjE
VSVVEEIAKTGSAEDDEAAENRSLIEDVEVLIEDGKTYLEAELNFQKTRALFAGERAKGVALYGLVGFVFAWMALIGLTFGLIFALAPILGRWGAMAAVVLVWLVFAGVSIRAAAGHWRELMASFSSEESEP